MILALCKSLLPTGAGLLTSRLCLAALTLTQPLLTNRVTWWLSQHDSSTSDGYGLIGATAILYLALAIVNVVFKRGLDRLVTMARGTLIASVHSKSLTLRSDQLLDGAAETFLSTDTARISAAIPEIVGLLVAPFEIGVAIFLLERQVGIACIAPVILSVAVSLASLASVNKGLPFQRVWLTAVQERIAYTAAVLSHLKATRMLGLTRHLSDRCQALRVLELARYGAYRRFVTVRNVLAFIPDEFAAPVTLVVFALTHERGALTPSLAFTALSLVVLLVSPIHNSILSIPAALDAFASLHRIEGFLLDQPEVYPSNRVQNEAQTHSRARNVQLSALPPTETMDMPVVQLEDVTVDLGKEGKRILDSVSLAIAANTLTVITGPVGSGKSTLLRAIIGDANISGGCRTILSADATFGYCAQHSWLTNECIRDIVIGTSQYDGEWFYRVLDMCVLSAEVADFPEGVKTVIGSKGLLLSGGQRQRLALARALYSRKSIVVLDDALSGLDATMSDNIVNNLKSMCRKHKTTVIQATNSVQNLHHADQVIVIGEGGKVMQTRQFSATESEHAWLQDSDPFVSLDEKPHAMGSVAAENLAVATGPEDEEAQESARRTGDFAVYRYYAASIGWKLGSMIIISMAISAFGRTFGSVIVRWWSEDVELADHPYSPCVWFGSYLGLACVALASMFGYLWIILVWAVPKSSASLHYKLLQSTMNASYVSLAKIDTGVILNMFATDMSLIEMQLSSSVIRTFSVVGVCIGSSILIVTGARYAAVAMPFVLITLYALQKLYLRTSRQLRFMELETQAPLLAYCQETQTGVATIRAFGWQHERHLKYLDLLDRSQRPFYILLCVQRWLTLVLDLIVAGLAIIVTALATSLKQTSSASSVGLSLLHILSFNTLLAQLVLAWTALETSLGAVARCRNFCLKTPSERSPIEHGEPPHDWPAHGCIQLCKLSASYTTRSGQVLKDISLTIPAGTKVGICGRSGSGKSSLLLTLLRMLDISSGQILVDDVDLATVSLDTVRGRFTALPQDLLSLPGSVQANLDLMDRHSVVQLALVLKKVGLWEIIESRGGLQMQLGVLGLSQGQMQLFAVARALLRRSKLLLLDEFTSAVDRGTEERILELINAEFRGSTVIAIAHRLNTIVNFDILVVMDAGRIVDHGTPQELLDKEEGMFRIMFEAG